MKASTFIGTSLDGFIARTNGSFDFLPAGGGEPHGYDEFMASVDALVIGRNTYEVVLAFCRAPILIGTGIPPFGAIGHDIVPKHIETRQYASGLVRSEYEVIG